MSNGNGTIPWFQSTQLRAAVVLIVLGLVGVLHFAGVTAVFGLRLDHITSDQVDHALVLVTSIAGLAGGLFWGKKRIAAGNDPGNTATPEIQTPAVVEAVKRLTQG
jgi:hypothetical protein